MTAVDDLTDFLAGQLADMETGWSVGTFGAIAEFTRDAGEPAFFHRTAQAISVVTGRGGLRIAAAPELRPIASESPTKESWSHRIALCLPGDACAMNGRTEFTELGADRDALRAEDRLSVLFDIGLGTLQVDVCVRTNDPDVVAALRGCVGRSVFSPGSDAMRVILAANPHRVFVSRIGRAEVYQPIPPPDGKSPDGPHTHVLPKLLAHGRTHAATEPLPEGWIPCAHFYPPHPLRDGLGVSRAFHGPSHNRFQDLLARYGDPASMALKRHVIDAVKAGDAPSGLESANDRFARATIRVALRQLQASETPAPALSLWLAAYDRAQAGEIEEPVHH